MIDLNERIGADFKVVPTYPAQPAKKNLKERKDNGSHQKKEKLNENDKGENFDQDV